MSSRKQKAPEGAAPPSTSNPITDPRFAGIATDPRFRLPSKKHTHVKLDSRFSRLLKDDDFVKKAKVDRYGRKIESDKGRKEIERLYKLEDEDGEEIDGVDDDEEVQEELARVSKARDPAREGGFSQSSSDEESEESDEEEEEEIEIEEEDDFGLDGQEQIPMGEVTSRLAAVNMDWDNIRAVDLMAVASSFLPPDGRIENVTIYPSEFGRERMEREELEGPPRELFKSKSKSKALEPNMDEEDEEDGDSEDEEERIKKRLQAGEKAEDVNSNDLRKYQLERLRYYYAVMTTSSPSVAQVLHEALDGHEYLTSANFFDLRFIPDDVSFDTDKPREGEVCDRVPDGYRPRDFVTDALTRSKVKLTWDEDDVDRKDAMKKAFSRGEIEEMDLKAYIGSDSSSDEDEEEEDLDGDAEAAETMSVVSKRSKADKAAEMRAKLGLSDVPTKRKGKEDKPVGDMQITFSSGLSNNLKGSVFENEPEETTVEKYVRKEKERKAKRKEKLKAEREGKTLDEVQAEAAKEDGNDEAGAEEDGFNDPFFDDPVAAAKDQRKKAKAVEKARQRAEEAANAEKKAEEAKQLELLMLDEQDPGSKVQHFDMKEIVKAEKDKKKRKQKKKGKKGEQPVAEDSFKVDTSDPRFAQLFDSHEFAIDPTNPRFKETRGMKALLDEGRKKRDRGRREVDEEEVVRERGGKKAKVQQSVGGDEELQRLVQKVKGKVRA